MAVGDDPHAVYRNTQARMFRADWMEAFSKVHPIVPALVFVPVVLLFLHRAVTVGDRTLLLPGLALGAVLWTLVEYTLHRVFFHITPRGPISQLIYFNLHGVHHQYPDDDRRLVMVPAVSLPLAWLFHTLFVAVLPGGLVDAAFAALVAGYLVYDYSHWAVHHVRIPSAPWLGPWARVLSAQRKRHMKHHFGDPTRGFGVSTGLWDHIFRTVDPN